MKKQYSANDVNRVANRAKNEGWRKGYALGVGLREARDEANELGYAVRLKKLKAQHANDTREAVDRASNAAYERGYDAGVRKMERSNALTNSRAEKAAYANGFDHGKEIGAREGFTEGQASGREEGKEIRDIRVTGAYKQGIKDGARRGTIVGLDTLIERAEAESYAKGYENGKDAGKCFADHDGLYNDGYAVGREEAQGTIKAERKDYIDQIKRSAKAAGELDGYERAIRILKNNLPEVLPF